MGQKILKARRALAKAKKKEKQGTVVTTDDGAGMMPINHTVTADTMSEMVIEEDDSDLEHVAITMDSSKAKASARSRLGAAVEAVPQDCGVWYNV